VTRSRRAENTGFACVHCSLPVPANTDGHYRNHCPYCLWSLHVDDLPGDRASGCRQPMEPVGLVEKSGKGWQVVHRCTRRAATASPTGSCARATPPTTSTWSWPSPGSESRAAGSVTLAVGAAGDLTLRP